MEAEEVLWRIKIEAAEERKEQNTFHPHFVVLLPFEILLVVRGESDITRFVEE